jgi:protein-tyrosine-phosphatase
MRVLFVCRGNICRSRVGARIFDTLTWEVAERDDHEARSAGTQPDPGGRAVTGWDVRWADVICVMEPMHEAFIRARWPAQAGKVRVVGIPDIYVRDQMGHHSIKVTVDIYGHLVPGANKAAVDRLDATSRNPDATGQTNGATGQPVTPRVQMVELRGIEPLTPRLPASCSPS